MLKRKAKLTPTLIPSPSQLPSQVTGRLPVEPLFAHHSRVWILVWTVTLAVTIVASVLIAVERAGSWSAWAASPKFTAIAVGLAALGLWGTAGLALHTYLFRHLGFVLVFVAGTWALVTWLSTLNSDYSALIFASVMQAFIFLPYLWALGALGLIVTVSLVESVQSTGDGIAGVLLNVLGTFAIGFIMSAMIFYIHHANREAALRQTLINQLQATQRDLAEREREAGVLEERARLSRDLHDTLAQGFMSIVTRLSAAELALERDVKTAGQHLATARGIARSHLTDIRRLVWALRPMELEGESIEGALLRTVQRWSAQVNVAGSFEVAGRAVPMQPDAEVAMLRILQEALANAGRHAGASQVDVRLSFESEFITLDVVDNGHGFLTDDGHSFVADNVRAGFGLTGMRERLRAFGGSLLLDSAPGEGTTLTAAFPLRAVAASMVTS
ncbi:sensor histidine kinase [Deinococcus oregonensis]|uniref:Sensor histidine kinase n=1 Tax=Deinococcus oregonensis TaxID=1805970 RepID=A0ABV6AWQ4_9DEIO